MATDCTCKFFCCCCRCEDDPAVNEDGLSTEACNPSWLSGSLCLLCFFCLFCCFVCLFCCFVCLFALFAGLFVCLFVCLLGYLLLDRVFVCFCLFVWLVGYWLACLCFMFVYLFVYLFVRFVCLCVQGNKIILFRGVRAYGWHPGGALQL